MIDQIMSSVAPVVVFSYILCISLHIVFTLVWPAPSHHLFPFSAAQNQLTVRRNFFQELILCHVGESRLLFQYVTSKNAWKLHVHNREKKAKLK